MTSSSRRITEPSLPEHDLIRAAGEMPQLSSGFRESPLSVCRTQVTRARRIQRTKVATGVVVACGLLVALTVSLVMSLPDQSSSVVQDVDPNAPAADGSPGSPGYAVGSPGPSIPGSSESQELDQIIEEAGRKTQKLIDAGMIPGF